MLRKLLKYEIKATARLFLPIYLVLLAYSAIHKGIDLLSSNQWTVPKTISMIVYVMILVGVCVMTIIITIQRFYKNLLSEEGYLMFTLPTKPWKLITSKLAVSMIWTAVSGIVAMMSICIIAYKEVFDSGFVQHTLNSIGEFFRSFGVSSILLILEVLLICIFSLASNALIIYASIAVGHLFNRYRILASFGAFIVINAITQIIFTVGGIIVSLPIYNHPAPQDAFSAMDPLAQFVIWVIIIFSGLMSAGYFILTNYVLSKRLNLE